MATLREQNLLDAMILLEDIKQKPSPNLHEIWADLTDVEIASEVDRLAHIHEYLNLS